MPSDELRRLQDFCGERGKVVADRGREPDAEHPKNEPRPQPEYSLKMFGAKSARRTTWPWNVSIAYNDYADRTTLAENLFLCTPMHLYKRSY